MTTGSPAGRDPERGSPWRSVWSRPATGQGGVEYGGLVAALRQFLAAFAGSNPPGDMAAKLVVDVERWTTELAGVAVSEKDQVYGQRTDLDSRGQIATPQVNYTHIGVDDLKATVLFDRLLLGSNGAAHGGAIAFLFDEVAGRLCHLAGRPTARTAYLRTNYRMVTPIDQLLDLDGRIEREEGRKRFLRLTLRQDGQVCADAEALMVALEPGQI